MPGNCLLIALLHVSKRVVISVITLHELEKELERYRIYKVWSEAFVLQQADFDRGRLRRVVVSRNVSGNVLASDRCLRQ